MNRGQGATLCPAVVKCLIWKVPQCALVKDVGFREYLSSWREFCLLFSVGGGPHTCLYKSKKCMYHSFILVHLFRKMPTVDFCWRRRKFWSLYQIKTWFLKSKCGCFFVEPAFLCKMPLDSSVRCTRRVTSWRTGSWRGSAAGCQAWRFCRRSPEQGETSVLLFLKFASKTRPEVGLSPLSTS